jgi:hypothetical protein
LRGSNTAITAGAGNANAAGSLLSSLNPRKGPIGGTAKRPLVEHSKSPGSSPCGTAAEAQEGPSIAAQQQEVSLLSSLNLEGPIGTAARGQKALYWRQ